MPTERLYHQDPLLLTFDARVVAHAAFGGAPSVVLDRSAFYPESGGQMADRGALAGHAVVDVQVDDDGVVHHVLEGGALPAVGASVAGAVDGARRRVHMALHTGQHLRSWALAEMAAAETVSSRLGESACTIDVDRETLDERRLAEIEDQVNAIIDEDVPVRAFFPDPAELASLPLRRAPKVTGPVRVVAIGSYDLTPCGGTHCTRSAQIGLLRLTGVERYKGKARVTFSAGRRARSELWRETGVLRDLGRAFTCGPLDVPAGVQKLRRELAEAREALGQVRSKLADVAAVELCAQAAAGGRAVAVIDDAGPDLLRALATRITASRRRRRRSWRGAGPTGSRWWWRGGARRRWTAGPSSSRRRRNRAGVEAGARSAPRAGFRRAPTGSALVTSLGVARASGDRRGGGMGVTPIVDRRCAAISDWQPWPARGREGVGA